MFLICKDKTWRVLKDRYDSIFRVFLTGDGAKLICSHKTNEQTLKSVLEIIYNYMIQFVDDIIFKPTLSKFHFFFSIN